MNEDITRAIHAMEFAVSSLEDAIKNSETEQMRSFLRRQRNELISVQICLELVQGEDDK